MARMKQAARAIIVRGNKLLVIHRNKFGKEYYTLPGGGVEQGETPEQAVFRELQEETGLKAKDCRLVFVEDAGPPYGTQYMFLCQDPGGNVAMHPDAIEAELNKLGKNLYTPLWLSIEDLTKQPFVSENLKKTLILAFDKGFPKKPQKL